LAGIIAYIFNYSFSSGIVPEQWKRSVITPVPKVSRPMSISQFRPISVTPILLRLAEKLVVRNWLFPAIDSTVIADQFAFNPTGSTTCALTFFMHHVTTLLGDNSYVRCLLIDFSKAFDVVDHGILVSKLSQLNIPPCILHWISCFLTGRTQQVKYATKLSAFQPINMGIVQGSGLGPIIYIVMESDLKNISKINILFKYADDNNLLVPEKNRY